MARTELSPIATVLEYREIYDRAATLQELVSLISDLDPADSIKLLCQLNADLRLVKRGRQTIASAQREIASGMLSEETIHRLEARFGKENAADRPIFHPVQVLNVIRLVIEHSWGTRSPLTDASARCVLGDACLMMTDLMMTTDERNALKSGNIQSTSLALMTQMMGPFEVQNPSSIVHVAYRSRIMYRELLRKEAVVKRIKQYGGFDFEREFSRIAGISLSRWLTLMLAFHAYFMHYLDQDGPARHPENLVIDRIAFRGDHPIPQNDLDTVLRSVSTTLDAFKQALQPRGGSDWRFDSVPFRNRPIVEVHSGKFYCFDLGLLVEKIHSGVYWTIHEGMSQSERWSLSGAWGILFEEYVNWFLGERQFRDFVFRPNPKWNDGTECLDGAFARGTVFMPMEYKGGFLLREAKYSGNQTLFEKEVGTKIVKGCKQLARKIEFLFNRDPRRGKALRDVPVDHVTRVVPLLVVQDQILGGPLINWHLNKLFGDELNRAVLRSNVTIDSLNVIGIRELETMAESAEAGSFDLIGSLQYRCYADPEMRSNLHNFLLECAGYGEGKSARIKAIIDQQFRETTEYLFGKKWSRGCSANFAHPRALKGNVVPYK